MTSVPAYQASGLASKLDTQGIIDNLVTIEGLPLKSIAQKQATVSVQISQIGGLMSNLDDLGAAATALKTGGLTPIAATTSYSDFTVSGTASNTGRYTVKVEDIARAAKSRSTASYSSGAAVVSNTNQTIKLSVDGKEYDVDVAAGTTLNDLATQINGSTHAHLADGTAATLPFTAAVSTDGSNYYLTLTNKSTGFVVGQPASSALSVISDGGGVPQDAGLGLATPVGFGATNAVVDVDGLRVERRTNDVNDAVPGVTLSLKSANNTNEDLVFANDTGQAASKLQYFVNAFNKVASFLQDSLDNDPNDPNSGQKLSGTITMTLQRRLQQIISTPVNSSGAIRTLRDLGVQLQKDGTVNLDTTVLSSALAKDPAAVNSIFSTATTGIGDSISNLVKLENDPLKGTLVSRRAGLQATTKDLTAQADRLQQHLDAYRAQLNIQFTALEQIMSGINNTANFLDQQSAQLNKK